MGDGLWPPLLVAAVLKHVDVVAMLIAAGADVNAVST
jgi:ankyrin repeat protein